MNDEPIKDPLNEGPSAYPKAALEKDELYPLLTVIQGLMLWAQEKSGKKCTLQMANSYAWPPVDPSEPTLASDPNRYYTTMILSFERVTDWNQMPQLDRDAMNVIAKSIQDYVLNMKPARS